MDLREIALQLTLKAIDSTPFVHAFLLKFGVPKR